MRRVSKLATMSILFAILVIPMRHAGAADMQVGLRKALIEFCWFNLFYVLALVYVVPRLP